MKITETIDLDCPSGFYCMNNQKKCSRINTQGNKPYCEIFYPFLDTDSNGKIIKCEKCLLAERKARINE
ncbi:MAG: hypothetical protein J6C96_12575 [Oscillospiraceae bacterium]|nr:hypothetical protein [Oscillospiraceae bacterium]